MRLRRRMLFVLSDSLHCSHSFWVRIGQYLDELDIKYLLTNDYKKLYELRKNDKLLIYRYGSDWPSLYNYIRIIRSEGIQVLSDIDDYLWFDGELRGWSKHRLKNYHRMLKECDILTCSTIKLKNQLGVIYPSKIINVIENGISTYRPEMIDPKISDKIRVGWTGAPWTRPYDLLEIRKLCMWMSEKSNIQIVHIGNIEGMASFASTVGLKEDKVEKIEYTDYKSFFSKLDLDVGLAPLKFSCFNEFKSAIKIVEYSSMGIPWIASNRFEYTELSAKWNLQRPRLCDEDEDWIHNMNELMDAGIRSREGKSLWNLCNQYNSVNNALNSWRKLLS